MKVYLVCVKLIQDGHPFKNDLGIFSSKKKALECVKDSFYTLSKNYNVQVNGFDVSFDYDFDGSSFHCVYSFHIVEYTLNGCFVNGFAVNLAAIKVNVKPSLKQNVHVV